MPQVLLAEDFGGPAEIEAVCLDVTAEGLVGSSEQVTAVIADALDLLGIGVVPEGCLAVLRLSLAGSRYPATYVALGECWTGVVLTGEVVLEIDGAAEAVWPIDDDRPPPSVLTLPEDECPTDDTGIDPYTWHWVVRMPLADMFGDLAHLAFTISLGPGQNYVPGVSCSDGEALQALASMLVRHPQTVLMLEALLPPNCPPGDLRPLIPYLIAKSDTSSAALNALDGILGPSFDSAEDWWAWYGQQG